MCVCVCVRVCVNLSLLINISYRTASNFISLLSYHNDQQIWFIL